MIFLKVCLGFRQCLFIPCILTAWSIRRFENFPNHTHKSEFALLVVSSLQLIVSMVLIHVDFSREDFDRMISKIPEDMMDGTFSPPEHFEPHQQGMQSNLRVLELDAIWVEHPDYCPFACRWSWFSAGHSWLGRCVKLLLNWELLPRNWNQLNQQHVNREILKCIGCAAGAQGIVINLHLGPSGSQEKPESIPDLVKPSHGVEISDELYSEPDFLGNLFKGATINPVDLLEML